MNKAIPSNYIWSFLKVTPIRYVLTIFLFFILMFSSCVSSRLLKEDEYLYAGAKIKIHADKSVSKKNNLSGLLKDETYPLPNRRILGVPVKLWIYSVFGNRERKKSGYIGSNYGELPVLMTDVPVDEVSQSLHSILKAYGYLDSKVKSEEVRTLLGKKQRKVVYHCYVEAPYHYRNTRIDIKDSAIVQLIDSAKSKSLLHPGDQYNLITLKDERERIDASLKQKGYYYFSPDFLYYYADSTIGNHQIDLVLRIKSNTDSRDVKPWFVNQILFIDNSIKDSISSEDTINYRGVNFLIGKEIKPKYMRHFLLFKKGELLTNRNYNITNKNLSSLGAFKYVNMDALKDTATTSNEVNLHIDITPNKLHNFKAETNIVSKSNDFAGPGAELSYTNRNLLGGAEQLIIKTHGSIEAWLSKSDKKVIGDFNYEFGASAELTVPRFLIINPSFSPRFVPDNHILLDARYINQMQFYRISFFRFMYGYRWSVSANQRHELNLIDITYQHLLRRTADFDSLLIKNSLLKQSFSDQFLVGTNYTFQYSVPERDPRKLKTAFIGSIDLSGNLLYGIQRLSGSKGTVEKPLKFFGSPYAQYVKVTVDYRAFLDLFRNDKLAGRVNAGLGLPVGNSGTLPGIKQYYLGGANSLRAFQFRSVGPGTYGVGTSPEEFLINHSGEILLVGNIENRFKLAKSLELAIFLDAGNIWLAKNDTSRVGGKFASGSFLKQLAVGWGPGLRYLNQYFIIRLDLGFPLHSPDATTKTSDLNPIWVFAIGYPF